MIKLKPGYGARLKEERKRLKLTQEELGNVCRVKRLTQYHYEKESGYFNIIYLKHAEQAGVNVHYVLFGDSND